MQNSLALEALSFRELEPLYGRRVGLALFREALGFQRLAADQRADRELDFAGELRPRARGAAGLAVVHGSRIGISCHLLAVRMADRGRRYLIYDLRDLFGQGLAGMARARLCC